MSAEGAGQRAVACDRCRHRGGGAARRSLRRSYHPSQDGRPRKAVEYLAAQVARTAAGAAGHAVPA